MHSKIFVCPDLHEAKNLDEVEAAIEREKPSRVVFLGDYFDQFGDLPNDARQTAKWLKQSLARPNRVHLLGNHDLAYMLPYAFYARCPGFSPGKERAISEHISAEDWKKLKLWHYEAGYLFSHAGWSDAIDSEPKTLKRLEREEAEAWVKLKDGRGHWMFAAGKARGGDAACGGLLWCDIKEFKPIRSVNQVFGHTPGRLLRRIPGMFSTNFCCDTAGPFVAHHYLLISKEGVELKRLDGGPGEVNLSAYANKKDVERQRLFLDNVRCKYDDLLRAHGDLADKLSDPDERALFVLMTLGTFEEADAILERFPHELLRDLFLNCDKYDMPQSAYEFWRFRLGIGLEEEFCRTPATRVLPKLKRGAPRTPPKDGALGAPKGKEIW